MPIQAIVRNRWNAAKLSRSRHNVTLLLSHSIVDWRMLQLDLKKKRAVVQRPPGENSVSVIQKTLTR